MNPSTAEYLAPDGKDASNVRYKHLRFVIGPTCVGKSTFLDAMKRLGGDKVTLIQIGKVLRAKYPPSYFLGSAAPLHTQGEAWQIMMEGICNAPMGNVIFVDGQPRDIKQLDDIKYKIIDVLPVQAQFIHLWVHKEKRRERMLASWRDAGAMELAKARCDGPTQDSIGIYEVLSWLLMNRVELHNVLGSDRINYDYYYDQFVGRFI